VAEEVAAEAELQRGTADYGGVRWGWESGSEA